MKAPDQLQSETDVGSSAVRRYLQIMEAGCRKNWTPHPGSDSRYINWLIWESLSRDNNISAEEADAAWEAFLKRHGDNYPGGNWREKELAYMATLASNDQALRPEASND